MDTVLQNLLSWQFILFCLALSAIVFVARKTAEYAMANWAAAAKESKLWNELLLPILPVILGPVFSLFAKQYPYPSGLASVSARVAFGLVGGLLSGLIYRIVKVFLTSKLSSGSTNDHVIDPGAAVRDTINKE